MESAPGQGPQGAAGVWAASQSKGSTKVLGILGQGTLTCWNPLRDALPFSQAQAGSWTRGEQGRTDCTPSGFPEVAGLQRDVARCFQCSFFLLRVLEATCKQLYPPLPTPLSQ